MKRPEVLFFVAAIAGLIIGKLIKNFKWGMLLGVLVAAIYAFTIPTRKRRS
ncbi:MAG: hypothetical protein MUF62_10410 [Chitinophagaceae bacterium]|jgi:high-affinity Fe2+/Pb2+ permease|nr:hypothetical protein [Chitinophagaceae bacterium]